MSTAGLFSLLKTSQDSKARAGELTTLHGTVQTPVFMPVASQGTVKALDPEDITETGMEMVLSNMYHLYLRPGIGVIAEIGGLHRFMNWQGAILTDSGGYQVFSLAKLREVSDEGVVFRSHIDGSEHLITPELAVEYQETLGADIIMVLDECAPHDADFEKIKEAMERTHKWAKRCLSSWKRGKSSIFAIVQGGLFHDLRCQSAKYLASLDFPGYGIGGLSIGEPKKTTYSVLEDTIGYLPEDKPRYLMGVGSPEDIVESVGRGVDMFDSALPTRVARNGALFTQEGRINISNAVYSRMNRAVEPDCDCYTCRKFSAAYLHHLFNARELLAYRLATIHNLTFINRLMKDIRKSIVNDTFGEFKKRFLSGYKPTDEKTRLDQKQKWLNRES